MNRFVKEVFADAKKMVEGIVKALWASFPPVTRPV
ncbi:hypothetical protein ATDW_14020 [Asticcacaulis sp. DW145]|nr:hypothetical protein ATDW_14020 [Asticcacaulis sp. DW145]